MVSSSSSSLFPQGPFPFFPKPLPVMLTARHGKKGSHRMDNLQHRRRLRHNRHPPPHNLPPPPHPPRLPLQTPRRTSHSPKDRQTRMLQRHPRPPLPRRCDQGSGTSASSVRLTAGKGGARGRRYYLWCEIEGWHRGGDERLGSPSG